MRMIGGKIEVRVFSTEINTNGVKEKIYDKIIKKR